MDSGTGRMETKPDFYGGEPGICRNYAAGDPVFPDIAYTGNGTVCVIYLCSHRTWNREKSGSPLKNRNQQKMSKEK